MIVKIYNDNFGSFSDDQPLYWSLLPLTGCISLPGVYVNAEKYAYSDPVKNRLYTGKRTIRINREKYV
jgi:hypothetical protein